MSYTEVTRYPPYWRRQGSFDPRACRWHVRDNALGQIAHQQCSFESYWAGLGLQGAKPFTQDLEHGAIGNGHEVLPGRSGEIALDGFTIGLSGAIQLCVKPIQLYGPRCGGITGSPATESQLGDEESSKFRLADNTPARRLGPRMAIVIQPRGSWLKNCCVRRFVKVSSNWKVIGNSGGA